MKEYKWANFLQGCYQCPIIQINSAIELKTLQQLAKQNKLYYYEDFCERKYKEILSILKTQHSFLVEYSYKGFTFAIVDAYKEDRDDPADWKIIQMQEIIKELEGK